MAAKTTVNGWVVFALQRELDGEIAMDEIEEKTLTLVQERRLDRFVKAFEALMLDIKQTNPRAIAYLDGNRLEIITEGEVLYWSPIEIHCAIQIL